MGKLIVARKRFRERRTKPQRDTEHKQFEQACQRELMGEED